MIKEFFSYYLPHKRLFMLDFGCAVLSGVLALGFPVAVAGFVDVLLPKQDWFLIVLAAIGLLIVYVINTGLMAVVTYWGHVLGITIETEMRRRAFDHLQKLSFRFYDNQKTGHLVARVTKDLEEIGEVAHHGPEDLFVAVMTFIGALILMFMVHVPLALIAMTIAPLIMWLVVRFGGDMTRNWQSQFGRVRAFNARIEENVGGVRVVRAFANEEHERALFHKDNEQYRTVKLQAYAIMAISLAINYLGMRIVQVVILLAGTYYVVTGGLSIGGFVGFLLLVNVFYQPLEKIAAVVETYPKGIAGFRNYQELMATEPDIIDRPTARDDIVLRGNLVFENVDFGYSPGRTILNNINIAIEAGETVAFVGPSGAGKTTLCSLVPRFYDVTGGRIMIDGCDIRDITMKSLRQQIGIVQQDVFLFAGTLRENIAYGRLTASDDEIVDAAHRARLDDLIATLPDGIDTVIGERGVKLSGGQKQRVAIARIFLKNPPILILDEATSALDTETERAIQQSLDELAQGRTTLVIAHRLATIRNANRIVVITQDGIAEQGSHDALLAKDGAYRRLHDAQSLTTGGDSTLKRA
ncbi:ABC transporter ATP-binding protein [Thalassospira povalilytica]|uniref:ABC transporter ATP-binding protein n=1 Tax=Thalassospira povalilytica TaxID=732237 RepID=A0A8I1MB04_9PROT|nr:ABC transporter ATP-binding protein [Thalassospira povalilytica]MBN8198314.1 ABC transporter ATP-binding protein [Thalassospira povalilytica]